MSRYVEDPQTGERRLNWELFLPLGAMILVGLTSLILGILLYEPPAPRDDGPIELPAMPPLPAARKLLGPPPAQEQVPDDASATDSHPEVPPPRADPRLQRSRNSSNSR